MRPLQNILNIYQYSALMGEGKKDPHSSIAGWEDCVIQVENWLLQDRTTTSDNLREKIRNYALNYLAANPGGFSMDKDKLIDDLADEIEDDLKEFSFFQQPPASFLAQKERNKIPEDPEKRFVKLGGAVIAPNRIY